MTTRSPSRSRVRSRAGFTLIELMAALVAGLIAIAAVYTLGAGSSRHFQEQQRIATTQTSLRMAMEQIRIDIERAGLYGIASTGAGGSSIVPPNGFTIQSIEALVPLAATTAIVDPGGFNGSRADGIRLVGNYSTTGSYLISSVRPGGSVAFQQGWQAFRRDFGVLNGAGLAASYPYSAEAFDAAFSSAGGAGVIARVLHVVTPQNAHFFPQIVTSSGSSNPPTVSVQDLNVGTGNPRATGFLEGSIAAPLSRVEYVIVDADADPALIALRGTTGGSQTAEGTHPVLVRREIAFSTVGAQPVPVPNTTRVVLEYVADFSIDYVIDAAQTTPTTNAAPNLQFVQGTAANVNVLNVSPWQVRSVIVSLSARTPLADPRFSAPTAPRVAYATPPTPLTRFRIAANIPGAAHVRTLVSEIRTPNNRR